MTDTRKILLLGNDDIASVRLISSSTDALPFRLHVVLDNADGTEFFVTSPALVGMFAAMIHSLSTSLGAAWVLELDRKKQGDYVMSALSQVETCSDDVTR